MKTIKSTRGLAFLVLLPWLAGAALAAFGYHEYSTVFAPGRNKTKSDQAAAAAAQTSQQATTVDSTAKAVKAAADTAVAAHTAVIAKRDAIDQNAAGFLEGAKQALAADPNPSDADIVATGLIDSATTALGQPITPELKATWTKIVRGLLVQKAEAQATVAKMTIDAAALRASLDATQQHANASDAHAQELTGQLGEQTKALKITAVRAATLTASVKAWADREPDLMARIKALGGLAVVLLIVIAWYEIRHKGLTGALHDAVAAKESVQATAVELGADATKLKAAAESWWDDDPKGKAVFEKLKSVLRI